MTEVSIISNEMASQITAVSALQEELYTNVETANQLYAMVKYYEMTMLMYFLPLLSAIVTLFDSVSKLSDTETANVITLVICSFLIKACLINHVLFCKQRNPSLVFYLKGSPMTNDNLHNLALALFPPRQYGEDCFRKWQIFVMGLQGLLWFMSSTRSVYIIVLQAIVDFLFLIIAIMVFIKVDYACDKLYSRGLIMS